MDKERLEWIASGLSRYALTKAEDQFLKAALEDSARDRALSDLQEERLENLYRQKSRMIPNKTASSVPSQTRKASPSKGRWKAHR